MSNAASDMRSITPLGAHEPASFSHGPVTVTEIVDVALASYALRLGHEKKGHQALKAVLGRGAPDVAKVSNGDIAAFWMGPDQWMISAPMDSHEDLADQLSTAAKEAASVTEQSGGWCRFDLRGDGLADVFERLCPVNMRAMKAGDVTRTSIDHLGCFFLLNDANDVTVYGPRSSAGSLYHALKTAIRSAH